jgi:cell wall-associated NlpC family hydrolase
VRFLDKIKTKSTVRDIKVLDKTADAAREAKNSYVRTKEQVEQTQQTNNSNYVEHAGDTVKESAQTVVQKAGRIAQGQVKKAIHRQLPKDEACKPADRKVSTSGQSKLAKRKFVQNRAKQTTRSSGKAVKETAKGTIKTSRKSIKTAGSTAKITIKTSQVAAKTAAKTAQTAVKATQRAIQAARMAVMAAKAMVKAVIAAVKAAIAAIKGLIALIAAGGWVVIVIILIICLVGFLIKSPLGIFFSGENMDSNVMPISNVVQEVNSEFDSMIEAIKTDNPDVDRVETDYPGSTDNTRIDNWMDVVAVFAVKTTMDSQNGMDVATIDNTRIDLLKSVFWDMNSIAYKVETVEKTKTVTVTNDDGTTSEATVTTFENVLHITVTSKTAEQQAKDYGFTDDQMSVIEEMLSEQFRPMMLTLLGMDSDVGLTPDQLQNLYNNLPSGKFGTEIVRLALSRLGDPYSQLKAGQGGYTDCSFLTQWCYGQVGISLPRTAADQAEYCVDNGLTISPADIEPGDLIFFSLESNGRFMNISHVAVYAGNGYIVDASSSRGQVVYRELFGGQVLFGRP